MLLSRKVVYLKPNVFKQLTSAAAYSRKSDSKNLSHYKVVKSNDVVDEARIGSIPNWELFGPKGYRFLLPGSLGPAWHEACSMVPIGMFNRSTPNKTITKLDLDELECTAQECPVLLRNGVLELFFNNEVYTFQELTIVTLTPKKDFSKFRNLEGDPEYSAKTFMWIAQKICMRLKASGYWADFINPFSGRPYLNPFYKPTLNETGERFQCLGFEIKKRGNCKVIQSRNERQFVGSLFTSAPADTTYFYNLISEE